MGRKVKYSKKQFVRAYKKAKTPQELANLLGVTIPTVYNNIKRYNLKIYPSQATNFTMEIAKAFTYDNTIKDLSLKFHLSQSGIRAQLRKLILYPDTYCLSENWSPPKKIEHIKVINALIKAPIDVIENPHLLLSLPGISYILMDDYWHCATGLTLESYK